MVYVLIFVGLVALGYLLLRAFGPISRTSRDTSAPRGPDDDPDFLFDLDRRDKHRDSE